MRGQHSWESLKGNNSALIRTGDGNGGDDSEVHLEKVGVAYIDPTVRSATIGIVRTNCGEGGLSREGRWIQVSCEDVHHCFRGDRNERRLIKKNGRDASHGVKVV